MAEKLFAICTLPKRLTSYPQTMPLDLPHCATRWPCKTMPVDLQDNASASPRQCHWISKTMPLDLPDATMLLDPPIYATGSPRLCDAQSMLLDLPTLRHWISKTMSLDPQAMPLDHQDYATATIPPRLYHWITKTMPPDLPDYATGSPRPCHWVTKTMILGLPDYAMGSLRLCHWIS